MSTSLRDLVERAAATFAEAFLAVVAVESFEVTNLTALKTAAVAAGLATAKWGLVQLRAWRQVRGDAG